MRVEIDDRSGFCFGVVNAISKAEEYLVAGAANRQLVSLGDIVHNDAEVARLHALGLEVAAEDTDLASLAGRTVLVRAHGEPPVTYEKARIHDITLVDATCPVVARLGRTVREAYQKMQCVEGQVVIFGKRGHAEVRGLAGQVGGDVVVVENEGDLDRLDFARPIYFLAQTTSSLSEFKKLGEEIGRRAFAATANCREDGSVQRDGIALNENVVIHDTVCRQVAGREEHLAEFARRHDVVVFVAGAKSSNGRVLFEAVRAANPDSHKIENGGELCAGWFDGKSSAGICGATSTPKWLMEQIAEDICKIHTR
jgi:4-hydroxy-3-methylbut-2-enyl diphosphate reductase